jgi:hypothetical protein
MYDDLLFQEEISLLHSDEALEVYIFNYFKWMSFNYDELLTENKRKSNYHSLSKIFKGNFMVPIEEAIKILGDKKAFNEGLEKAFFKKPEKDKLNKHVWEYHYETGEKKFKPWETSWLKKEKRKYAHNIWQVFKDLMKKLSQKQEATGGSHHKYERINITQFMFFILLIGVRNRRVPHTSPKPQNTIYHTPSTTHTHSH